MASSANRAPAKKAWLRVPWGILSLISWVLGPILWPFFLVAGFWSVRHAIFPVRGRVTRKRYWNAVMLYFCAGGLLAFLIDGFAQEETAPKLVVYALYGALAGLIALSATMTGLGRLRDRNMRRWWLLLYYGLPAALVAGCSVSLFPDTVRVLLGAPVPYLVIWAIVALGVRRGTPGANPYGPDEVAQDRERARLRREGGTRKKAAAATASSPVSQAQDASGS